MPIKSIRSRIAANNVLQAAIATTSLAQQLSQLSSIPAASAAVGILLIIFETIQSVQSNKDACIRLANRAARILLDVHDHMAEKWERAPPILIKNLQKFEGTLNEIYVMMKAHSDAKWNDRWFRRTSIEDSVKEYHALLDDAVASFQIAALINIQMALEPLTTEKRSLEVQENPPSYETEATTMRGKEADGSTSIPACEITTDDVSGSTIPSRSAATSSKVVLAGASEDYLLSGTLASSSVDDDHGFRRYHQSEVRLKGRSRYSDIEWWAGALEVSVDRQKALMKKYDGPRERALKNWMRDVKVLSNVYHQNMPQMIGYSDEKSPTPFILISPVMQRRPEMLLLGVLQTRGLARSAELMLRFYRDISDATLYTQNQLGLTDSQMQDFVQDARFQISDEETVVMGLPPPKEGNWVSFRNYSLSYSILQACLAMLPNRGRISYLEDETLNKETQRRVNHLVSVARGLLPTDTDEPVLSARALDFLGDEDVAPHRLTWRQIRASNLDANLHTHSWYERSVPAHKYNVGDIGHIPSGKGFEDFQKLGNIIADGPAQFDLQLDASGDQWCWKAMPMRREPLDSFDLPNEVKGWAISVPPQTQIDSSIIHEASVANIGDAWRFLLNRGPEFATNYGIQPEDLILITNAGTHQNFYINQFGHLPGQHMFHRPGFAQHQPFGLQQSHYGHHNRGTQSHLMHSPPLPAVFYLFTSLDPKHEPYYSQNPMCVPPGAPRPELKRGYVQQIGWCTGFLHYVQLHEEDFRD